ncbi:MAG: hypothetical protein ACLQGV_02180 [Bryobacteraceae bacterium]
MATGFSFFAPLNHTSLFGRAINASIPQGVRLRAAEAQHAGGQGRAAIPDLPGTDQPERRIFGKPLGAIEILIGRGAAAHGLAQQVRQRELRVLPLP